MPMRWFSWPGMGPHEGQQAAQLAKLLPVIAGILLSKVCSCHAHFIVAEAPSMKFRCSDYQIREKLMCFWWN